MNILKLAWRNVWRNGRRSSVTIAAMTLALVAEILYSGMVSGLILDMEEDAVSIDMGDIQILTPDYATRASLYEAVEPHEPILAELDARGYRATPRLFAGGLAASGESSAGVTFLGVDPVRDATVLDLHHYVDRGSWLDADDPLGVVLGRRLAHTLGVDIGGEVVVLSQGADGSVANELFTVRGILLSVSASTDRTTILMGEQTFRTLMVFEQGAHKILVRRPVGSELDLAAAEVRQIAEANGNTAVAVKTWKELNPFLAQYIDTVSSMIVIVFLIVYLAVAILILNAMLMAVYERIREIGVLKAIGYGPLQVLSMMVLEGLIQAAVATVLGGILAAPGMWYLATYGIDVGALGGMEMAGLTMPAVWKAHFAVDTTGVPVALLFFIVLIAVIFPALKAAWIRPVQAMNHH